MTTPTFLPALAAPAPLATPAPPAPAQAREAALREQAIQLESFLFAELLRASGTAQPSPGGGGETQFDSFLRQSQAEAVARAGQTGLAESIFRSLSRSAEAGAG